MEAFKSKINAVRDILRKDGVTGIDSITHCVAFYILRNLDIALCEKLNIPVKFAYCNFNKDDNGTILDHGKLFEKFYLPSRPMDCFVGILANKFKFKAIKQFGIKTSRYLESIFNIFEGIDPKTLNCNCDIVGTIYEIHLATGTSGSGMRDLGQYFTHRKVIKFMIELCAPKVVNGHIETILDPSMGTGGFLTMATKYLNEHNPDINWTVEQSNIIGFDISDSVQSLAYINLLLENGELFENIVSQDTLHNDLIANNVHIDKVDNILANVPFGLKNIIHADCAKRIVDLKIRGTKAEPLFLQLIMLSLKENGRGAVIIPDGVLFNDAKLHSETRKYLIENMNLKKIVSLDDDEFFMNTGVKSSILYFVNDGTTQEVEFSKIKLASGQIAEESLKKVKKADLVAKGYTLFINKYLDNQVVKLAGVEYKKLGDICEIKFGTRIKKSDVEVDVTYKDAKYPCYGGGDISFYMKEFNREGETLIISRFGVSNKCVRIVNGKFWLNDSGMSIHTNIETILQKYLNYYIETNLQQKIFNISTGSCQKNINIDDFKSLEIPIPPLAIQQQIVSILDNTYSIINTNKEQIARYEAQKQALIWSSTLNCSVKKLKDISTLNKLNISKTHTIQELEYIDISCIDKGLLIKDNIKKFNIKNLPDRAKRLILKNDILLSTVRPNLENYLYLDEHIYQNDFIASTGFAVISANVNEEINSKYIYYIITLKQTTEYLTLNAVGSSYPSVNNDVISNIEIPIPSPEVQSNTVQQCEHIDSIITMLSKDNERLEGDNLIQRILESLNGQNANSTQPEVADATPIEPTLDSILESIPEANPDSNPVEKKIVKKTIGKKTSK